MHDVSYVRVVLEATKPCKLDVADLERANYTLANASPNPSPSRVTQAFVAQTARQLRIGTISYRGSLRVVETPAPHTDNKAFCLPTKFQFVLGL